MSKKKQKKQKVIYYDDNSTIADMSNIPHARKPDAPRAPRSTFREKMKTYFSAVKMMIFPMCVVLFILALLFLILMLLRRAPRFVFCDLRFLLHYVYPAFCLYMAVITPRWLRALSVERSFLRAIPQIFFTSFTAPLPSPPRGIFFRRVSAPRVPVLLVTFYPLVRL